MACWRQIIAAQGDAVYRGGNLSTRPLPAMGLSLRDFGAAWSARIAHACTRAGVWLL